MKTLLLSLSLCCGLAAQDVRVTVANWNSVRLAEFAGRFPAFNPTVQVLIEDGSALGTHYVVNLESPAGKISFPCARSSGAATNCVLNQDIPDPVYATVQADSGALSRVSDVMTAQQSSIAARIVNLNSERIERQNRIIPFREGLPPVVQVWFRDSGDAAVGYLVTLWANGAEYSNYVPRSSAAEGQLFTSFYVDAAHVQIHIRPVVDGLTLEE